MNILAIDPGGTTGIAMKLYNLPKYLTRTADTPEELWDLANTYLWDDVLCERFTTAGRISKYGIYTVELVGGVKAICYSKHIPFVYRSPQNRTAFQDKAIAYLEHEGTSFVEHEADALAHLMAWLDKDENAKAIRR